MEIIDLTYDLEEGMTTYPVPWQFGYEITRLGRHGIEGRASHRVTIGTHVGTHMDAPLHFVENGQTIDQIPMDIMLGPVTIYDLSHLEEDTPVTPDMLKGQPLTERVILKYGWEKHWGKVKFYSGYPFISEELAHYFVKNGVKIVGTDAPGPEDTRVHISKSELGTPKDSPIHKILLNGGVIIVEYLANLGKITDTKGWNWTVLPMKIKGSDGAPVRTCLHR